MLCKMPDINGLISVGIILFCISSIACSVNELKLEEKLKEGNENKLYKEFDSQNDMSNDLHLIEDGNNNEEIPKEELLHLLKALVPENVRNQLSVVENNELLKKNKQNNKTSAEDYFYGCSNDTYPPKDPEKIPLFHINLDDSPEERWTAVAIKMKDKFLSLEEFFKKTYGSILNKIVDKIAEWFHRLLPSELRRELEGMASASGVHLGLFTLLNIAYEASAMCESIVMIGENGQMYHGRNLDFGDAMGWDEANHTWYLTELLRPMTIRVNFIANGSLLYSAVTFAGYTGVLTAVKKNAFSLTVNERFKLNGGYVGIAEWVLGWRDASWLGIVTRRVMETARDYEQAKEILIETRLVAPVYFILSGNSAQEGAVITRGRHDADLWDLSKDPSLWYLLETNSDHWTQASPNHDPRRYYGNMCMDQLGAAKPFDTLYRVLSTRPILNAETAYTALMEVSTGSLQVWRRQCPDPCPHLT